MHFPLSSGCCNTFPLAGFLFLSSLFNLVALYLRGMTYAMKHYASKVSQQSPPLHPASLSQAEVLQPHKNSLNPFEV